MKNWTWMAHFGCFMDIDELDVPDDDFENRCEHWDRVRAEAESERDAEFFRLLHEEESSEPVNLLGYQPE